MKFKEKIKAIQLRKRGKSYAEILKEVKVSKSTISKWLKDIELNKEQKNKLMTKRLLSAYKGAKTNQENAEKKQRIIINQAKKEVFNLIENPLFSSGLMLYWAEGNKRDRKVAFSNSDPNLIYLMMRWFREICHVPESKFRVALHIHNLHIRKDIRNFWSETTGISLNQFTKDIVKPTIYSQRKNKLYEGICRITINNIDLLRRIIGWEKGVMEFFNKNKDFSIDLDLNFTKKKK